MAVDDFVLSPRRLNGRLFAERLCDGETVEIAVGRYDRVPVVYRGQQVWGCVDAVRFGVDARGLCEAVQCREASRFRVSVLKNYRVVVD